MTIKAQGGNGKLELCEDFFAGEDIVAETAASRQTPMGFRIIGQGIAEADSGITVLEADGLNGVGVLTTTDETEHSCGVCTAKMFDVALNGTLVFECRVLFVDLDTKEFYFGLTDVNDDTTILEGGTIHGAAETITLTASDLCGFFLSAELTEDEMWHMVYNGGTATGVTDSTALEGVDAVAGEFQILRIEVDPNGTARWFIDNVLKQTVTGAVSTTTDLAVIGMVEAKGTENEYAKMDYFRFNANRDWNA